LQKLRHTVSPPGLFPTQLPGQSTGGLRQVTQTPSTAVPLCPINITATWNDNLILT